MKKYIGKIIIGIGAISMIIVLIVIISHNNKNNSIITRPSYDYIATIYHSVNQGIDAGTEYTYDIYKSAEKENEYFYIKSKAYITIAGLSEKEDIDSGSLKNKNDLKKILNDIEKDSTKNAQSYISFAYNNNGKKEESDKIDFLENKLFK